MKELLETGVSLDLEYCPEIDGLVGRIKGFAVAVRENNETRSYGCLLWAKEGDYNAVTTATEYLAERVTADPETVKNFKVQGRGIAVALGKTDDAYKNVNIIKRFLIDLTNTLSVNFYKSCCYDCGKTTDLGIYHVNGVPAQYCKSCSVGKTLLKDFPDTKAESGGISFDSLMPDAGALEAAEKALRESAPDVEISDLLTEVKTDYSGAYDTEVKKEEIDDSVDVSGLMMVAEPEKPEYVPPKSELFERIEREYLEEQKNAPKAEEKDDFSSFMVTPIDENGNKGEALTVTEHNEGPVGHNASVAVTEYADDSNIGEDIDVTEIESTVSKPTVTTGHEQLTAIPTPLDENGRVPLMNPNSVSADNRPSPVNGPDAVTPSEYLKPLPKAEQVTNATPPGYMSSEDDPRAEPAPRPYDAPAYVAPINWGIPDSNPVLGIIGALTFAVLGVFVWALIGRLGYISYIGSLALVASVYGGYRLAGGSIDTKGKVICTVLSLLLTFISFWVVLVVGTQMDMASMFGYNMSFFSAIEWAVFLVGDNKFIWFDLVISMAFTIAAAVFVNKRFAS